MNLIIYIGASILILGIGAVIWIFLADKKALPPTSVSKPTHGSMTTSQILKQLGLNAEEPDSLPESSPAKKEGVPPREMKAHPRSEQGLMLEPARPLNTQGTASLRLGGEDSVDESEKRLIDQNEQLKRDIAEMQSKNEKQEALLEEKNKEIEQITKDLESELKSRKEFNKIKDILEKELKDSKEKNRSLQIDLTQAQTEADSYLKRVKQLEDKIKKLDVEVQEKTAQFKEQEREAGEHKKNLEILDKKLKGWDPIVAEKDRKINSLVPLLKDLPEGRPENQTKTSSQEAVAPTNIAPPTAQNQEGEGMGTPPPIKPEKKSADGEGEEIHNNLSNTQTQPVDSGQKKGQSPPVIQIQYPAENTPGEKNPFNENSPKQPPLSSSSPKTAEPETPLKAQMPPPAGHLDPRHQATAVTAPPTKIDDIDRIRRLASSDNDANKITITTPATPVDLEKSIDRTPKDLLKTIEADGDRNEYPGLKAEKQEDDLSPRQNSQPKGLMNFLKPSLKANSQEPPHLRPDTVAKSERDSPSEGQNNAPTKEASNSAPNNNKNKQENPDAQGKNLPQDKR